MISIIQSYSHVLIKMSFHLDITLNVLEKLKHLDGYLNDKTNICGVGATTFGIMYNTSLPQVLTTL